MNLPALFLLTLAPGGLVLQDETIHLSAQEARVEDISLSQRPALLDCSFSVLGGGSGIRVALLTRAQLVRFRSGLEHEVLGSTAPLRSGHFQYEVLEPGEYALLLDNRREGRRPVDVELKVSLSFRPHDQAAIEPGFASPKRRLAVVALSLAFFFAVVAYAGRIIRKALASY
jgi:hypothetical protein